MTTELWIKSGPHVLTSVQSCSPVWLHTHGLQKHAAVCRRAHRSGPQHTEAHTLLCEHARSLLVLHAAIRLHTDTRRPQHTPSDRRVCCDTALGVMSTPQAVGIREHHSKGCFRLQGKGCKGSKSDSTGLLPAQAILPVEGRTSACWGIPGILDMLLFHSVLLSTRQQAHELLILCGDLYHLQQPLHTLLMPLSVPRTDPAPSRGQDPLIYALWISPN